MYTVITGRVLTCDSAYSWRLYSAALLRLIGWLVVFYVVTTSKVILGWAPLRDQVTGTMS